MRSDYNPTLCSAATTSARIYESRVLFTEGGCNGIDISFFNRDQLWVLMKRSYDKGHIDWKKFNEEYYKKHPWLDEHNQIKPEWKGRMAEIEKLSKQMCFERVDSSSYLVKGKE